MNRPAHFHLYLTQLCLPHLFSVSLLGILFPLKTSRVETLQILTMKECWPSGRFFAKFIGSKSKLFFIKTHKLFSIEIVFEVHQLFSEQQMIFPTQKQDHEKHYNVFHFKIKNVSSVLDSFAHWGEKKQRKEKSSLMHHSPSFFHESFRNQPITWCLNRSDCGLWHYFQTAAAAAAAAGLTAPCPQSWSTGRLATSWLTVDTLVQSSIMSKNTKCYLHMQLFFRTILTCIQ